MKKFLCMLMACILVCAAALAAPRLPQKGGAVVDDAAALSQHTVEEIAKFREIVDKDTGVRVTLVTVDFLDGYTIDGYAEQLMDEWDLNDDALLILLAVGEDKCAAFAGKDVKLSATVLRKITAASLEPAFLAQDYDGAARAFFPALATELSKAYGRRIDLDGLFGVETPRETIDWLDRISRVNESISARDTIHQRVEHSAEEHDDDGMSLGKLILTFIFLSMIFGKKGRRGCGCGPLAGLFGLFKLWDRD